RLSDGAERPRGVTMDRAAQALSEAELLPRHCRGDGDAFPALLQAFRAPVYGYLVRCGVAEGTRDDLFQEIFLKVHQGAGHYSPGRPLKPWLFTIVANCVRDHFRRRQSRRDGAASVLAPDDHAG